MESKVKVVADPATGSVVHGSNNEDFGYIRLEQVRTVIDEKSQFLKRKVLSTLIHGEISALRECGYYAGQELPGKILVEESFEPFNSKNPERDLKIAGQTGIVCLGRDEDGTVKPIYRRHVYSPNPAKQDVTKDHINKEEIKAAFAANSHVKTLQPNQSFDNI
jgi:hypothetical protein